MRALILSAVLLPLCLSHSIAQADETFTSKDYAFTISSPASWTRSEPTPPAEARYALKLARVENAAETSVTVYVINKGAVADSKAARDAAEENWKTKREISDIKKGNARLAGVDAHWLKADYQAAATEYTLRQNFLVRGDYIYVLQSLAPRKDWKAKEKDLNALLDTFAFIEDEKSKLKALADKCGSEIPWAHSWKEASDRARREKRSIVVVFEVYRGIVPQRYTPATLFMDTDIVELMNERFVGLYWDDDTNAPFDDPRKYGLGPSTFGQGLLFASHDGEVLGEAVVLNSFHVYDAARDVLARHPGAPAKDQKDVALALRRAELERAEVLIGTPQNAASWRLYADLKRRQRNADESFKALAEAQKLDSADSRLERGVLQMRLGQYMQAAESLKGLAGPQAVFWHALATALAGDAPAARALLEKLIAEETDDRWAWRAAALLAGRGVGVSGDSPAWPSAAQLKAFEVHAYQPAETPTLAVSGAITFLLENQQPAGTWLSPRSLGSRPFTIAPTAICARALIAHRDDEKALAACEAALKVLVGEPLYCDPKALFDYNIWSEIFGISFLARCIQHGIGSKELALITMRHLVTDLRKNQLPGGGWAYFHGEGLEDNSIGFVTAAAVLALREAQAAGLTVEQEVFTKACDALDKLKHPSGSWGYMWATGAGSAEKQAEAAMRSPLHAMVMRREGRGEVEDVRKALDVYLKHRAQNAKERGKGLCHTGPEGTASYYLLYGLVYAAEAVNELPEKDREKYRKALLEDVLSFRQKDGSFCDNPSIGRQYGAAMALEALRLLQPR